MLLNSILPSPPKDIETGLLHPPIDYGDIETGLYHHPSRRVILANLEKIKQNKPKKLTKKLRRRKIYIIQRV